MYMNQLGSRIMIDNLESITQKATLKTNILEPTWGIYYYV